MNKKEKQQIKYLLENLKWYSEAPNEQDYNGEYEPPMEWEQGEAKIFLKYLEEKDKEIDRLNDVVNELIVKKENLMKYKRFIYNIIITPCDWNKQSHYQLHNYTKQNLYEQLYNLRKEIIDELEEGRK